MHRKINVICYSNRSCALLLLSHDYGGNGEGTHKMGAKYHPFSSELSGISTAFSSLWNPFYLTPQLSPLRLSWDLIHIMGTRELRWSTRRRLEDGNGSLCKDHSSMLIIFKTTDDRRHIINK